MSQAVIDWLEDIEIQRRIHTLREAIDDYVCGDGTIKIFESKYTFIDWISKQYQIEPTQEELDFVDISKYFP